MSPGVPLSPLVDPARGSFVEVENGAGEDVYLWVAVDLSEAAMRDQTPVLKLVNLILKQALSAGASRRPGARHPRGIRRTLDTLRPQRGTVAASALRDGDPSPDRRPDE